MNEDNNQRGYFRIDDEVLLHVKKIDRSKIVDISTYFEGFRQSAILTARFNQQRSMMAPVFDDIKARDSAVAIYCTMLSEQVDLLANRLLSVSVFSPNELPQTVNLSAEGMRFHTPVKYEVGDQLEIIYALLPAGDYIPVLAEVVRSEWDEGAAECVVSVKFVCMNKDDKELVIHHILYLERQLLQQKRLTG